MPTVKKSDWISIHSISLNYFCHESVTSFDIWQGFRLSSAAFTSLPAATFLHCPYVPDLWYREENSSSVRVISKQPLSSCHKPHTAIAAGCLTMGKMAEHWPPRRHSYSTSPTHNGWQTLCRASQELETGMDPPHPRALPINTSLQFPSTLLHKQWPLVQLRDSMCLFSLHVPGSH